MNSDFSTLSSLEKRNQTGFSLIELMIAMTLSLMLLGAVIQVFLSSKITSDLSDDISRIQENGRFSLEFLARDVRMAGFSDIESHRQTPNILNFACKDFNPCTSDGTGTSSDRIAVTLNPQPDAFGVETDCTGAITGPSDQIANVYFVETDAATGISSLMCRGFNITLNDWNAEKQPLVDGIDNMQVLYGIHDGPPGGSDKSQVRRFVGANSVTNWGDVRAVRIGLLVSSGTEIGSADQEARTYALLNAPQISITDKHKRQIYTATMNIPNVY